MTRLSKIHRQLYFLRRWRQLIRGGAAWSALLTAVLWILLGLFALDLSFKMEVTQRVIVLVIGAGVALWAFRRYTVPLLGVRENEVQLALMVERTHGIDSDLVAAVQFEWPEAVRWGSRQLEDRVIDVVADIGRSLNVFEGFSSQQLQRRAGALLGTAGIAAAVVFAYPMHARTFLDRLLLGDAHYPSATTIELVQINHGVVLDRPVHGSRPETVKCPEGLPVTFTVKCVGQRPDEGLVRLWASSGRGRPVPLEPLTLDERRDRLVEAGDRIRQAVARRDVDLVGPWAEELAALTRFDAPHAADAIVAAAGDPEKLQDAAGLLDDAVAAWPGRSADTAVLRGQLPRLVDSLTYRLYANDAWTDDARIEMIPLPVVELRMTTSPPRYAKVDAPVVSEPTARQIGVLEGSRVQIALECTNGKPLREAWLTVTSDETHPRYQLTPKDGQPSVWQLTATDTPFARVKTEIRFEAQVTDEDGLHLDAPLRGYIRIKADRPPTCTADVVHRVVLPAAKPKIEYRANDDYGISRLVLHLQIERAQNESGTTAALEQQTLSLLPDAKPIAADHLPLNAKYVLELARLQVTRGGTLQPANLGKGDRVKLTLEAVDFRGDAPGESYVSDPLVLEISDEAGVLAAIAEADERSEQRLTDIIKEQLGIGESR